jgi:ribonuclease HI
MITDYTNLQNRCKIYTDGSSSLKTGICGWSVIVKLGEDEIRRCGWAKGTNQFAELFAVIYALRKVPTNVPAVIYSDSEYSIKSLTTYREKWQKNGFKNATGATIAYKELIREGHRLLDSFADLALIHVRGHSGLAGNEEADKLAKAARYIGEGRPEAELPVPATGLVMVEGVDPDTGLVHARG